MLKKISIAAVIVIFIFIVVSILARILPDKTPIAGTKIFEFTREPEYVAQAVGYHAISYYLAGDEVYFITTTEHKNLASTKYVEPRSQYDSKCSEVWKYDKKTGKVTKMFVKYLDRYLNGLISGIDDIDGEGNIYFSEARTLPDSNTGFCKFKFVKASNEIICLDCKSEESNLPRAQIKKFIENLNVPKDKLLRFNKLSEIAAKAPGVNPNFHYYYMVLNDYLYGVRFNFRAADGKYYHEIGRYRIADGKYKALLRTFTKEKQEDPRLTLDYESYFNGYFDIFADETLYSYNPDTNKLKLRLNYSDGPKTVLVLVKK